MSEYTKTLGRRSFLRSGLIGAAGLGTLASIPSALGARQKPYMAPAGKAKESGFLTRPLGKTGVSLPIVSMGVMNSNNENLIKAALDGGIMMLDTANGYQRGTNETVIGGVLKGRPRDSYFLATKVPGEPRDRQTGNFSAETTAEAWLQKFDVSLQRLGLDYVDIVYLHNVQTREAVLFEPLMKALESVKKAGKARFIGVSSHSNEQDVVRAAIEGKLHDVVLVGYNFRKTNLIQLDAAIAEAAKAGIGIVAMKTLAGGFWDRERKEPINVKAALKWALSNPHITTAIPGMTSFDQLELNMQVMKDAALTAQEKADLKLIEPQAGGGLYCQGCNECAGQCPNNLPVPSLMRGYMYAYGYRNLGEAYDLVSSLGVSESPCSDCSRCAVKCAMGFDVKERASALARLQAAPGEFFG
ncbi:MAG: aldo/keto reductase [Candidatus Aminicenantes bacterium]|nr:aldo/keto reductase [Candidatus Aminicenantes bacterium]